MVKGMIQYIKTVLEKVSFDKYLFEKELKKALKQLGAEELIEFKNWCYEKFSIQHGAVLNRNFVELAY